MARARRRAVSAASTAFWHDLDDAYCANVPFWLYDVTVWSKKKTSNAPEDNLSTSLDIDVYTSIFRIVDGVIYKKRIEDYLQGHGC